MSTYEKGRTWENFRRGVLNEEEKRLPMLVQGFLIMKRYFDNNGGEEYLLDLQDNIRDWNYIEYIRKDPIWHTVRNFATYVASGCANCNLNYKLEVHHLSYRSLGVEIYHLEDLIVYCDKCHCVYTELYKAGKKSFGNNIDIRECSSGYQYNNVLYLLKENKKQLYEMVQARF